LDTSEVVNQARIKQFDFCYGILTVKYTKTTMKVIYSLIRPKCYCIAISTTS